MTINLMIKKVAGSSTDTGKGKGMDKSDKGKDIDKGKGNDEVLLLS